MYQHIMIPLDGSELAECVLPHLVAIARGCTVSQVTLIRVAESIHIPGELEPDFPPMAHQQLMERVKSVNMKDAKSYLARVAKQLKYGGLKVRSEVLYGNPADELANYVKKNGVDLVIISTHGRSGPSHWSWGSVASRTLRYVGVPIFMVRPPECFLKM